MGIVARFLAPFHPRRMVSLVRTRDPGSARNQQIQQDAAADVAAVEQDDNYFGTGTSSSEDDL
jgi:hypothetical protein